ncbi:DUF4384 domain-containing protein [bacterium]|nr:DUF4384 domain-containing protein [bacterium]
MKLSLLNALLNRLNSHFQHFGYGNKTLSPFILPVRSGFKVYKVNLKGLALIPLFFLSMLILFAPHTEAKTVKGVKGEGEAAVVGMTAEQCQGMALRRARADAIEKAAGTKITSSTLVRDARLVTEFLKSFSHGFVVNEKIKWLPLTTLRDDEDSPPIPLYRVEIDADVQIPEKTTDPGFFMKASLDRGVYMSGDNAKISLDVSRDAHIAIFNLMADDKIAMLYPGKGIQGEVKKGIAKAGGTFHFPPKDSGGVLEITTMEGHQQDSEAFFIIAVQAEEAGKSFRFRDYFSEGRHYTVPEFFSIYSRFADTAIEEILPYEVRSGSEE